MSDTLSDAIKWRDVIKQIASDVIQELRPKYRYGFVNSIDTAARTCMVTLIGDSEAIKVTVGSVLPTAVNQLVRVDGLKGDRYISDVIADLTGAFELTAHKNIANGYPGLDGGGLILVSKIPSLSTLYAALTSGRIALSAIPADAVWTGATLQNSWTTYTSSPAYRLSWDARYIEIAGTAQRTLGAPSYPSTIFTLPVGLRPSATKFVPCVVAAGLAILTINTDGTVQISAANTTGGVPSTMTSFDGIRIPVNT